MKKDFMKILIGLMIIGMAFAMMGCPVTPDKRFTAFFHDRRQRCRRAYARHQRVRFRRSDGGAALDGFERRHRRFTRLRHSFCSTLRRGRYGRFKEIVRFWRLADIVIKCNNRFRRRSAVQGPLAAARHARGTC